MLGDREKVRKISFSSMFLAIAIILSYIEYVIPLNFMVPGVKPGLANMVNIIVLFSLGPIYSFTIGIMRIIIMASMFGSMLSFIYSFSGFILSFILMYIVAYKFKMSEIISAVLGAIVHNIAQIFMAIFIVGTKEIIYYLPVLLLSGFVFGMITGILSSIILRRLERYFKNIV